MKASHHENGAAKIVRIEGRLDATTQAPFCAALEGVLDAATEHLIIDMEGVTHITAAGMRVLVRTAKARSGVGSMAISGLQPRVKKVLDIAGFRRILGIYEHVNQAIASLESCPTRFQPVGDLSDAAHS